MIDETNMRLLQDGEPLYSDEQGRLRTGDGCIVTTYDFDEIPELRSSNLMQEIKLEITITDLPKFYFRFWLFRVLMRLAVRVGGFGGVEFIPMQDLENPNETH